MADQNEPRCQGTNKDGGPCSAVPMTGEEWCVWHHPRLDERRREWSRVGGQNKATKKRARKALEGDAMTLREVAGVLSRVMRKLETGQIEPNYATATATVARALVAVTEAGTFEERLAALEERAGLNGNRMA